MSLFRRSRNFRPTSMLQGSCHKQLRMESLERKLLLAGNVTAVPMGSDLYITGDIDDNSILIARDESLATPGIGDISISGVFGTGTTVNGLAVDTFSVSGNIYVDFSSGGNDEVQIGENVGANPNRLELAGDVSITGSSGNDNHSSRNATIYGSLTLDDSAGGAESFIGIDGETIVMGDFTSTSSAASTELDVSGGSSVGGDVVLATESAGVDLSFLGVSDSSIGDDVKHFTLAASSDTLFRGADVGDDVIIDGGDGDDIVTFQLGSFDAINTIGDDLRIYAGGGDDEVVLAGFDVDDDLVFRGGDGDDIFEIEASDLINIVGDDLYVSSGDGVDDVILEGVDIDDKLRVSTGAGEDVVTMADAIVGRSALISLGGDLDEADIQGVDAGRGLTVFGRGTNVISLEEVSTSHYVTIVTASGDDEIDLQDVTTSTVYISTHAGEDIVDISHSDPEFSFDFLFVFLGSGDDVLTLDNVNVDGFALLHGGSGEDTLIDIDDASEINFELDFAFETYGTEAV